MKLLIFLFLYITAGVCQDTYPTKHDDIDIDSIIKNERLFKNYVDCLLDKGKCTSDAEDLKKRIPDALQTDCARCTDKQKEGIRKVVKYLAANKRDWFDELIQKYDPEEAYSKKYKELSNSEGFEI